ncbi:MAG: hypothetical protein R3D85_13315 [Paracoccaceae bacterium]
MIRPFLLVATTASVSAAALPVVAQQVFTAGIVVGDSDPVAADLSVADNAIIQGDLCIGAPCLWNEAFDGADALRLKDLSMSIHFIDQSFDGSYPTEDWRLLVNDSTMVTLGGLSRMSFQALDTGTIPFTVLPGPDNAFWLAESGDVGLGTSLPQDPLHIKDAAPVIRFEATAGAGSPAEWRVAGLGSGFGIGNETDATTPVSILRNAPTDALVLSGDGARLGSAASTAARLHVVSASADPHYPLAFLLDDRATNTAVATDHMAFILSSHGHASLKIEELSTTTAPRRMLTLRNNGRPEIVMGNTDTGGEWSFGAGTNFILKQGGVETDSSTKTKLFEITPTGDATLAGSLTTGGPACAAGCDAVLAPGYDLPSVADHAAQMFALGHLPNVGPTLPGQPVNLSERYGRLLNELEHAHIYIAQLEARDRSRADQIEHLAARLDALAQAVARP